MEIRPLDATTATNAQETARKAESPEPAATPQANLMQPPGYMTPIIKVEPTVGLALLVVRDANTGEVQAQYPAERVVEEYRHAEAKGAAPKPAATTETKSESAPVKDAAPSQANAPSGGETPAAPSQGAGVAVMA